MKALFLIMILVLSSCSIIEKSDRFEQRVNIEIGGMFSYIINLKFIEEIILYNKGGDNKNEKDYSYYPYINSNIHSK